MCETSGFRVGIQAHMMPTLTSITDHMNDSDAYPIKSQQSFRIVDINTRNVQAKSEYSVEPGTVPFWITACWR